MSNLPAWLEKENPYKATFDITYEREHQSTNIHIDQVWPISRHRMVAFEEGVLAGARAAIKQIEAASWHYETDDHVIILGAQWQQIKAELGMEGKDEVL